MFFLAVSEFTRDVDRAFWIITAICVVLFVGIALVMGMFAFTYHRSKRPTIEQIAGNNTLEVIWTILPTILVFYIFYVGYADFLNMRQVPEDAMVVEVTGKKWAWEYYYPEEDIMTNTLVVPVNQPVKFLLHSTDVLHSFYLPDFRVKEDCVPGREGYMWLKAEVVGTYNIFCAEYCGQSHSTMLSELEVVDQKSYKNWVRGKLEDKNQPVDLVKAVDPESQEMVDLREKGKKTYETICAVCHQKDGLGGGAVEARNLTEKDGWVRGAKISDIYVTLTEGLADVKKGSGMAAFTGIQPWDRFAVAHYVASLGKFDSPEVTPEDLEKLRDSYPTLETGGGIVGPKMDVEKAIRLIAKEAREAGR